MVCLIVRDLETSTLRRPRLDLDCWATEIYIYIYVGRDISVGIATRYGQDIPGIESRWGRDFRARPDRPWGPLSLLKFTFTFTFHVYKLFAMLRRWFP